MPESANQALVAARYELIRELRTHGDVHEWEAFDSALQRRVALQFLRQDLERDPAAVQRFWSTTRSAARGQGVGERVLDAGTDPETGRVFVVREWPAGATLNVPKRLERTTEVSRPPRAAALRVAWLGRAVGLAVAAVILIVGVLPVARSGIAAWLAWANEPIASVSHEFQLGPAPTAAPTDAVRVATTAPKPTAGGAAANANAKPVATVAATSGPVATPTPSTTGVARRVVNTDGRGVALRGSPGGDRLPGKGYDEGATVTAFESSGEWTRIVGPDGRQGWVLSVTLAP